MSDKFAGRSPGLASPAEFASAITPSDGSDLPTVSRALYVGVAGDIRVATVGGDVITFRNVQAGMLPVRVRRVYATETTAADLIAVW
ncbi:MAG: hypothetical protein AAF360_05220 [Pseudomonadota bacterium]